MDKFETSSNASDCPSSNLSSFSGLTGFEDELDGLKSVMRGSTFLLQGLDDYENGSSPFDSLQLNERYRNDFNMLEGKLELAHREKLEKLSGRILQLEKQLANENSQLATHQCIGSCDSNVSSQLRGEIEQLEALNNGLRLSLEEQRIDLDAKSTSVTALKGKIVDLHLEVQSSAQSNIKLNNDLRILRNELISVKKSESWYKDRLHECRKEKAHFSEEISQLHSLLISKERELNVQSNKYLQVTATLEDLRTEYGRLFQSTDELDAETYKATIGNLNVEVTSLKIAVESQREAFEGIAKQNGELLMSNADLLRCLSDKDSCIAKLENDKKDLIANVEILEGKLADFERLTSEIADGKLQVEIALEAAKREKTDVEDTIGEIRGNFSKLTERFRQIQGKLFEANRRKRELEETNISIRKDSEKLALEAEETRVTMRKALDREVEKSNALAKESHLLAKSNFECEAKRKSLEYEVCKLRQRRGSRSELVNIKNRMIQIENRFRRAKLQAESDEEQMSSLKILLYENGLKADDVSENVKHLKALCKAKELEIKEKEKRFQSNYRTLLRKVKEHMRGRNAAEKHCKYLQELHEQLAEEMNTSQLQRAVQSVDLQNLRSEYENLKNSNVKAKQDFRQLQEECRALKQEAEDHKETLKRQKYETVQLEEQNRNLSKSLGSTREELSTTESQLQKALHSEQAALTQYLQEQQRSADLSASLTENEGGLKQVKVENEMLRDEVENLKMKLGCVTNELTELREQKIFSETKRKLEEIIISNLKSDIRVLENDLDSVRSDKYFLQRLCNDLKCALTTSRNQNETFKRQMATLASAEIPSPSKCDDEVVNELLKRSLTPQNEKPLYELHNNLNFLKKEMLALQKQVLVTYENAA